MEVDRMSWALLPCGMYHGRINKNRCTTRLINNQITFLCDHNHFIFRHLKSGKCAVCSRAYIVQIGNQPANGVMAVQTFPVGGGVTVDGYPAVGIQYHHMC